MNEQANIDENTITCPNCQANYSVAPGMLGESGRLVKCAKCQESWKAVANPVQKPIADHGHLDEKEEANSVDEDELDAGFEQVAEEIDAPASSPQQEEMPAERPTPLSPEAKAQQQKDMHRRKSLLAKTMPKARLNKLLRIMGAILLTLVLFSALFLRENVVRTFPDLAGLYGSVGLGVNVVGLEFSDEKTLRILRDGDEVMDISAGIVSVSNRQVSVPRIIVTLLDDDKNSVFEWSVTSRAAIMLPGEWIEFETKLNSPPKDATSVQLTFESTN